MASSEPRFSLKLRFCLRLGAAGAGLAGILAGFWLGGVVAGSTLAWGMAAIAASLTAACLIFVLLLRPLGDTAAALAAIAGGAADMGLPQGPRGNEFDVIGRALLAIQKALKDAEAEHRARDVDRQAFEQDKIAALKAMADTVEEESRDAVDAIAEMTRNMAENAGSMADSAGAVDRNSESVTAAANQALANVRSVAAAAEELAASIREIAGQVSNAATLTASAVADSDRARQTMAELSATVARIGEVAGLINDIAAQTNLLALNATIEAARAGDAGKGFAVVAGEVKALASQTARATGEIGQQIAAIESSTRQAVQDMDAITGAIHDVQKISTVVTAAIQEQGAATAEIARTVGLTSDAAQEVAERIACVSHEAHSTGERAAQVGSVSVDVAGAIERLRAVLIRVVRTATTEVDRRKFPRYEVDRPCTIYFSGRGFAARMTDWSEGGFCASGDFSDIPQGGRVELEILGIARRMTAVATTRPGSQFKAQYDITDVDAWRKEYARIVAA